MREFSGKVAVVTGAASGIGRALADRLAGLGMKVVLADIEAGPLDKAVAELRAAGHDATGIRTDVSSLESVQALAKGTLDAYGAVHLVCNNAGVEGHMDGPIWEATERDWAWTLGVNLWGVVNGVNTFLPIMVAQGEGYLTITASATGYIYPRTMYNVSKHCSVAYAELLYYNLKQQNAPVGLTLLCPGSVATNIFRHDRPDHLRNPADAEKDQAAAELRQRMAAAQAGRGKDPGQVADALIEGIKDEQFYVFNDTDWDFLIRERNDQVLNRTNPTTNLRRP
jgi:NAD(P)-dependent dehydrogenase (short-subunit alcohol dehydrogenase family)